MSSTSKSSKADKAPKTPGKSSGGAGTTSTTTPATTHRPARDDGDDGPAAPEGFTPLDAGEPDFYQVCKRSGAEVLLLNLPTEVRGPRRAAPLLFASPRPASRAFVSPEHTSPCPIPADPLRVHHSGFDARGP